MEEVPASERIIRTCLLAAGFLARLSILFGALVLIGGYGFQPSFLTTLIPGTPPVTANTAVLIMLLGISLWILVASPAKALLRGIGIACAVAALGVDALMGAEHWFARPLGVDWLFIRTTPTLAQQVIGQPSTEAAIGFWLLGLAMSLIDINPKSRRLAQLLSIGAMLIAWLSLVGRAFRAALPTALPFAGMTLHTALAIVGLGLGTLLVRPDSGLMVTFTQETAGGIMLRRLVPGALVAFPLLGAIASLGVRSGLQSQGTALVVVSCSLILLGAIAALFTARALNRAERALHQARAAEISLRQRIEGISEAASTIHEAVAALPSSDLQTLFQVIVLKAQSLTGADLAAFGIGNDPSRPFAPWVFSGVSDEQARSIGRNPRPVGTLGVVAREGQTLRLSDIHGHRAWQGLPHGHPPIRSFLGVPVRFRGKTVGNLYLANKRGAREFTIEDLRATEMLAGRAGIAIETARLYKTEEVGRAWLQGVIDQMPEGVIIVDGHGRIMSENQAAVRFSCDETGLYDSSGRPITYDLRSSTGKRVPWEETPIARAAVQRETVVGAEFLLMTKGGHKLPVLVSATPIRGADEGSHGAVVIFRDISILKDAEKLREEWTSVIAHDLRQPVSVIALAADILKERCQDRLSDVEAMCLTRIDSSARNLKRMIQDLLDTSCIEANRLDLEKTRTDLPTLLREAVAQTQDMASDRKIHIRSCEHSHSVSADPARLQQVFTNLLSNAIKYSDAGSPIEVALECANGELFVSVSNYGPGIPSEHLPHLFERFYRVPGERRGLAGIGLGLYICKGIVEAHDGRIWVESTPGGKTRFTFSLPELRDRPEELPRAS